MCVCVPVRVRECGAFKWFHKTTSFSLADCRTDFLGYCCWFSLHPSPQSLQVFATAEHHCCRGTPAPRRTPQNKKQKVHACVTAIQRRVFVNVLINPSPDQRVQRSWVLLLRATVSTQSTPKACKHTRMNCTAAQRSSQRELYSVTSLMGQNFTT